MAQVTSLVPLDKASHMTMSNLKEACAQKVKRIRDLGEHLYVCYRYLFGSFPQDHTASTQNVHE